MEIFEIHITGSIEIHEASKPLGLKTIAVDLLRPDKSVIRTEHMTSIVSQHECYADCLQWVNKIVEKLKDSIEIIRIKIETPYYEHYLNQAIYIESHFITDKNDYPISRNLKKTTFLGTDREYARSKFPEFNDTWKHETVELCLFDTFVEEDKDWFSEYKRFAA